MGPISSQLTRPKYIGPAQHNSSSVLLLNISVLKPSVAVWQQNYRLYMLWRQLRAFTELRKVACIQYLQPAAGPRLPNIIAFDLLEKASFPEMKNPGFKLKYAMILATGNY